MASSEMNSPVVSVVIPCRNAGPWIADAILSALSQTYSSVEVIVVDDGSTDESRDIIRSFEGRIRFDFINHRGAGHARNRGVKMASGEFIQFLDADDILFPHCVTRKMEEALKEKADVVYSGGFFFDLVRNVADAFVKLLESGVSGPVNIASGQGVVLRELIYKIVAKLKREDLVRLGAVSMPSDEPSLLVADVRRLHDEVGWTPKYDLDTRLEQTIEWWKHETNQ